MNPLFYLISIYSVTRRIKILTKDRDYELSLRNTKLLTDDLVLVASQMVNNRKNTFLYQRETGGIRTVSGKYLSKALLTSNARMHVKLSDNFTPADNWKITPQTNYNTISNSSGYCFKLGELNKASNYMDLHVDTCNDTDPMQQFYVIDLDRVSARDHGTYNLSGITNIISEPLYYGE